MVGVKGNRFPAIRAHLRENIEQVYKDLDISYVPLSTVTLWPLNSSFSFESFPGDTEADPEACTHRFFFLESSLSPSLITH
jgi:hypothetical protein